MVKENRLIARLSYREYAQCELSADLALVPEVAEKVRAYCCRHGLDGSAWTSLELALVEGLNNAIEHGCRGIEDARIRIRWHWMDEELEIAILDPGGYLPGSVAARLPDPLSEGGRGAFVMAALMDGIAHEVHEGWHTLVLRKRLGPPTSPDPDADATLEAMTSELSNSYETITALFRFGEELATAQSFDDFVEQVQRRLLKLVGGDETWLRLDAREGALELVRPGKALCRTGMPDCLLPASASVETQAFGEAEQQTVEDCSKLLPTDPARREQGCAIVCPVLFRESAIGVLSVLRERTTPYFTAGEIQLIGAVADFVGIARTMAISQEQRQVQQRTERELEIASEIQQSLLPKTFPENGRLRIFGLSQTAHEVGGDYFDVLPMGEEGVLLAIADVMGKGMPAALLATLLRTTIRAHSDLMKDPGKLLTVINRQLGVDLNSLGMFITVQLAFFSNETDEIVFASAGHCPLLKFSPGAAFAIQSSGGGVPLGVLEEVEYETMREPIAIGDRFIFFTDGIYEAASATGEMLGLDLLAKQIAALCAGDPRVSCERLLDFVATYSAGAPSVDDRTLLIAERLET